MVYSTKCCTYIFQQIATHVVHSFFDTAAHVVHLFSALVTYAVHLFSLVLTYAVHLFFFPQWLVTKKINFLAYNPLRPPINVHTKIQPNRSSRLAGYTQHIFKCLVSFYRLDQLGIPAWPRGVKLRLQLFFPLKLGLLNLESQNHAKNIPVGLY